MNEKGYYVPIPYHLPHTLLRIKNINSHSKTAEEPEAQRERNLLEVTHLDASEDLELDQECLSRPGMLSFGPIDKAGWILLCHGAVLYTVSVQQHPRPPPTRCHSNPNTTRSCENQNCIQTLPNIAWEAKQPPVVHHSHRLHRF